MIAACQHPTLHPDTAATPVPQPPVAGKLTNRRYLRYAGGVAKATTALRSPRATWRSLTLAPLLAFLAILTFSGAPALAAEGGTCPNETIRLEQGVSEVLPDCRAYEMVSPAYQEGYPLGAFGFAANGDQAVIAGYGNVRAAGEGEVAPEAAVYLDKRGVDGWGLESLNAPLSRYVGEIPVAYEAETGVSLWIQHTPQQSAPTRGLYIREASGNFSFVGPLTPGTESGEESSIIEQEDAGPDYKPIASTVGYSHIVMSAEPAPSD